jgi:hypothetical protein
MKREVMERWNAIEGVSIGDGHLRVTNPAISELSSKARHFQEARSWKPR